MADNKPRTFITIGERLIDCTNHCDSGGMMSNVYWTDEPAGIEPQPPNRDGIPACAAYNAPWQGENVGTGTEHYELDATRLRGCIFHAKQRGLELHEQEQPKQ